MCEGVDVGKSMVCLEREQVAQSSGRRSPLVAGKGIGRRKG